MVDNFVLSIHLAMLRCAWASKSLHECESSESSAITVWRMPWLPPRLSLEKHIWGPGFLKEQKRIHFRSSACEIQRINRSGGGEGITSDWTGNATTKRRREREREVVKGCLSCRVVMTSEPFCPLEERNPLKSYDKRGCDHTREILGLKVVNNDVDFWC